jgi:GT2 family glycosyltransferase
VIVVDSGEDPFRIDDMKGLETLKIQILSSERSVCIQRNKGIAHAEGDWVFLCDDDLEVPPEYLAHLVNYINSNEQVGAVSGLVLQKENEKWDEQYPVTSSWRLLWNYIFQLSIWGEIKCKSRNPLIRRIEKFYQKKGNHISKAGWPVLTNFSGTYFITPIYGLGASLVKRLWLLDSPYDEVLDANGIGDNYGVAVGFPSLGIHVVTNAFVYHYKEAINRPLDYNRYLRRILALHYFIRSRRALQHIRSSWFLWSLIGNFIPNMLGGNKQITYAIFKSTLMIVFGRNPYFLAVRNNKRVTEPVL